MSQDILAKELAIPAKYLKKAKKKKKMELPIILQKCPETISAGTSLLVHTVSKQIEILSLLTVFLSIPLIKLP